MIDVAMRTRAARYYALAMDLHDRGMWAACANARRIACIMWHLADPSLQWPNVVHC